MEAPAIVKRYNLAPPTENDLFISLNRLMTPDESQQVWSAACRASGFSSPTSLDQFELALLQLKEVKGIAAIAAISMLVRLKSYRTLLMMYSK